MAVQEVSAQLFPVYWYWSLVPVQPGCLLVEELPQGPNFVLAELGDILPPVILFAIKTRHRLK